jgi:hypothetical protein
VCVDLVDQFTEAYPSMCKIIKLYKETLLTHVDITIYNSPAIWIALKPEKTYLPTWTSD